MSSPPRVTTGLGELVLEADAVAYDSDETLVIHDPDFQRQLGLHALYIDHTGDLRALDQFATNYQSGVVDPDYIERVRAASANYTGNSETFEQTANAYANIANDGVSLSAKLRLLPRYHEQGSDKDFWTARSRLVNESGVPLDLGKSLGEGIQEFIDFNNEAGKKQAVISNSRKAAVRPVLDVMLREGCESFDEVLALAGSGIARKPQPDSMIDLRKRFGTDNILYIGNAVEDIEFGMQSKAPCIILGSPVKSHPAANYIGNARELLEEIRSQ